MTEGRLLTQSGLSHECRTESESHRPRWG